MISNFEKPSILITAFLILISGSIANSATESICYPKAERRAQLLLDRCLAKNQRSTKVWPDLQAAKNDVEFYLRSFQLENLNDYMDCDARTAIQAQSEAESTCKSDINWIDKSVLKKVSAKLQKREPGEIRLWKSHGANDEFTTLCDLRAKEPLAVHRDAHAEPCENDGSPLIELRKSEKGFSISKVGSGW